MPELMYMVTGDGFIVTSLQSGFFQVKITESLLHDLPPKKEVLIHDHLTLSDMSGEELDVLGKMFGIQRLSEENPR